MTQSKRDLRSAINESMLSDLNSSLESGMCEPAVISLNLSNPLNFNATSSSVSPNRRSATPFTAVSIDAPLFNISVKPGILAVTPKSRCSEGLARLASISKILFPDLAIARARLEAMTDFPSRGRELVKRIALPSNCPSKNVGLDMAIKKFIGFYHLRIFLMSQY